MGKLLFNIPIYLRSPEQYKKERLDLLDKTKKEEGGDFYFYGREIKVEWQPWEFNDIVGYYQITINNPFKGGDNINGITVAKIFTENTRLSRDPKPKTNIGVKDIWYHKKLSCFRNQKKENKKITLNRILEELSGELKENKTKTKRYYINLEYYKNYIDYLDWDKLK